VLSAAAAAAAERHHAAEQPAEPQHCRVTDHIAQPTMCVVCCPLLQLPSVITLLSSLQSLNIAA
jgi:hypothetical protein